MKIDKRQAELVNKLLELGPPADPELRWTAIVEKIRQHDYDPDVCREAWSACFADWDEVISGPAPIWFPDAQAREDSNLANWMNELGHATFAEFHRWTVEDRAEFWRQAADRLGIVFKRRPTEILDQSQGPAKAAWFTDAQLNIIESCFQSPDEAVAIVAQRPARAIREITYGQLRRQANRVSNSLVDAGCRYGDAIAVVLPMTAWSVSIYLGIVQAGCMVVSIADSFAPPEIASRLQISGAKLVFTYDSQLRAGKKIPSVLASCRGQRRESSGVERG